MSLRVTRGAVRFFFGVMALMFLCAMAVLLAPDTVAADQSIPIDFKGAGPRKVEDSTELAIMRDYAAAWKAMKTALGDNRLDVVGSGFVGTARERLEGSVREQQKSGLRTRYVDRGHKVQAFFYSPDGSALQLKDVAQVDMQVLDGDKVLHSESLTMHYLVLMTVADIGWKVRVFEAVPEL